MKKPFIHEVIQTLDLRIKQGLPGIDAHRRAMPADRDPGPRYAFENLQNPRKSSVLIMLYPDAEGNVRFPLMERQDYGGVHSGQVSLPGGRAEKHDTSLIHTALRETEEEIGVPAKHIEVVGELSQLYIPPSNYLVTPVLGYLGEEPVFNKDPRDVKEIFSVKIEDLLDDCYMKVTDIEVRGQLLKDIPYFHFEERVVWGATAMILCELATLLR